MNAPAHTPALPKLPGVIDTLSVGYRTLNRHVYLLLVPVLLDIFYWLGPRLSVGPVARQTTEAIDQIAAMSSVAGVSGSQAAQSWALVKSMIEDIGDHMNLLTLLSSPLPIPSLPADLDAHSPLGISPVQATLATGADLIGVVMALLVLGVALGALYMGLTAQAVRDGRAQPLVVAQRLLRYATHYIGLLLLVLVMVLIVGLPVSLIVGFVTLLSPPIGSLLMALVWAGVAWVYFNLFFSVNALFVSEVGPVRALFSSITVVRLSTSSAVGLLILMITIPMGMAYVWDALGSSDLARLAGILGNAYIGTGLTVASMIFYRDRINTILSRQQPAVSAQ